MQSPQRLPRAELEEYLYTEPLEPVAFSPEELAKLAEEDEWQARLVFSAAARKCCRLIVEAARSNSKVMSWLMSVETRDSVAYSTLLREIGERTPKIGEQINALEPPADVVWWSIANAKYVLEDV